MIFWLQSLISKVTSTSPGIPAPVRYKSSQSARVCWSANTPKGISSEISKSRGFRSDPVLYLCIVMSTPPYSAIPISVCSTAQGGIGGLKPPWYTRRSSTFTCTCHVDNTWHHVAIFAHVTITLAECILVEEVERHHSYFSLRCRSIVVVM